MNIDLENDFKKWFNQRKKSDGTSYGTTSKYEYVKALKYAGYEIDALSDENKNIFKISSLEKLKVVDGIIRSYVNYEKINIDYGNGALSAALNLYAEFLKEIESIEGKEFVIKNVELENKVNEDSSKTKYDKEKFLKDVFIDERKYDTLVSLLERKKNIILNGVPGVGKTYMATKIAQSIIGVKNSENIEIIQFHQSYSYEDFIIGYRPNGNGFELKTGVFYNFCERARKNKDEDFFFIIDEINRGNVSKIFGELLMLIENDKRDMKLKLAYSEVLFDVPENVYIMGLMNTADRSLAIIDYALRRRFAFIDVEPAFNNDKFKKKLESQGAKPELIDLICTRLNELNNKIIKDKSLGLGFVIGHSYFCKFDNRTNWYEDVINFEIKPLLEEYWFDNLSEANEAIEKLLG